MFHVKQKSFSREKGREKTGLFHVKQGDCSGREEEKKCCEQTDPCHPEERFSSPVILRRRSRRRIFSPKLSGKQERILRCAQDDRGRRLWRAQDGKTGGRAMLEITEQVSILC